MKVLTIVGTRPEIIRLSRVIAKLDEYFDHKVVHTGQNYDYELNEIFYRDLGLRKPDFYLDAIGADACETIGRILSGVNKVLKQYSPEAVLILGDTNSSLSAYAAKRNKIPVFHMEAGNRCYDERVPEEINRRIVDHISDVNLTYSDIARQYLIAEGISPERVIKTGSPMLEVINFYKEKIERSNILKELCLKEQEYFVVSAHREENIDNKSNFKKLQEILGALARKYMQPIIFSTHPRTRKALEKENVSLDPLVKICKPFSYTDYVKLQMGARVVLSDSGTITEEASILGLRAINIRETHERPEGMEEATAIMTALDINRIFDSINVVEAQAMKGCSFDLVDDYKSLNVSEKVVRIILSYEGYVKREVWKKY